MPRIEAPAKINWTLEVLGRRPDGYHEIGSVMATVTLQDRVELEPSERWSIEVHAPPALQADLAANGNIMERAIAEVAVAWKKALGEPGTPAVWPPEGLPAARMHLEKRIPAAAGLGGGSSDAAAALRLVSGYWREMTRASGPPARQLMLQETAALVGSDVPFFLASTGTALVLGRGEHVQAIDPFARQWLVLLVPPIRVERKTARLYSLLGPQHYSDRWRSLTLAGRPRTGDPAVVCEADIFNVFDAVADAAFPGLRDYREELSRAAGAPTHLCGAGPTLFALVPDVSAARAVEARLQADGHEAYAVCTPASGHNTETCT